MPQIAADPAAWQIDLLAGAGVSHHRYSQAAFVDVVGAPRTIATGYAVSPMFSAGAVEGLRAYDGGDRTVWLAAAGGRMLLWRGFFASFELGAVSATTPAFSSNYQFVTSFGWQWTHGLLQLRHISNAGFEGKNYGYTALLAGVSFR
jgi:hypothetical protein